MKLLFILTSSILLLSSCTQYRYDVTYEKCNGQTGSLTYVAEGINTNPYISSEGNLRGPNIFVRDICSFNSVYTRNPIE